MDGNVGKSGLWKRLVPDCAALGGRIGAFWERPQQALTLSTTWGYNEKTLPQSQSLPFQAGTLTPDFQDDEKEICCL